MNSQNAQNLFNSIDATLRDIHSVQGSNPLIDAYLARYLVVYISGVYEEIVETIFVDFAQKHCDRRELASYIRKSLSVSFRNPDTHNVKALVRKFEHRVLEPVLKNMAEQGAALDSIVNNKNTIAHGGSSRVTLSEVIEYYEKSREYIEKIDEMMS